MDTTVSLDILAQPDNQTCGPTALHAVYRYYGDDIRLDQVIEQTTLLDTGGTLAVHLACHALRRGYSATIYTYNLQLFDPSWFIRDDIDIAARLMAQATYKEDRKLRQATEAYLEFFALGGRLAFRELKSSLIKGYLKQGRPILTGLSSTYLYECPRELDDEDDDIRGYPAGHFAIICGYDAAMRRVLIADPLQDNPRFGRHYYQVGMDRLIGSIFLGSLTYDANLLIIEPRAGNPEL